MERRIRTCRNPCPIVAKLNAGLNAVLRQQEVIDQLNALDVEFRENTPEELRAFVKAEIAEVGTRGARGQYHARLSDSRAFNEIEPRSRRRVGKRARCSVL